MIERCYSENFLVAVTWADESLIPPLHALWMALACSFSSSASGREMSANTFPELISTIVLFVLYPFMVTFLFVNWLNIHREAVRGSVTPELYRGFPRYFHFFPFGCGRFSIFSVSSSVV